MVSTRTHPNTSPERDPRATPTHVRNVQSSEPWAHTPSNLTIAWLLISLPLVAWDTGYVMLRPHSMPGGWAHWPLWVPYELYGRVDYIYGWKAFNEHNGFTSAQGLLNIVESLMYAYYLYILVAFGKSSKAPGRGAPNPSKVGFLGEQRFIDDKMGGVAVLVAFSAAVMTVSKTALYWMNEYYSGFANIGHNDFLSLLFLWIIPNGAWLVLPSYMIYVTGSDILQAMSFASRGKESNSDIIVKSE